MANYSIEIDQETYFKIDVGQLKTITIPLTRTVEKAFSSCPPDEFELTASGADKLPPIAVSFRAFQIEKHAGKDYALLSFNEPQPSLF